jgi:hypothetical protein
MSDETNAPVDLYQVPVDLLFATGRDVQEYRYANLTAALTEYGRMLSIPTCPLP